MRDRACAVGEAIARALHRGVAVVQFGVVERGVVELDAPVAGLRQRRMQDQSQPDRARGIAEIQAAAGTQRLELEALR